MTTPAHALPLEFLHWLQPCEQCGKNTPSKILFMKAGYGNACGICEKFRKGRPYISKGDLKTLVTHGTLTLEPQRAKGGNLESRIR